MASFSERPVTLLKDEVAPSETVQIGGQIVYVDLEIRPAIPIYIALDRHERAVLHEM
jgi:hypothetical protein